MIKAEKWHVHIHGKGDDIIAEMCCIIKAVYDEMARDIGADFLDSLVDDAKRNGRIGDRS